MTGAQALAAALLAQDVRVVFGLPGVHNLPAWAALREAGVRLVTVRHEQTAVYAADGHARTTGELGVALVTTGPGAANALAAAGEAWASGSPVLVVATDIPAAVRRPGVVRGVLHEPADQAAMFAPVTAATVRVGEAAEVPGAVAEAVLAARRRPGPALLEIPTDLLAAEAGEPALTPAVTGVTADRCRWPEADALIGAAERPLVWAGGGAVDAGHAVRALAESLGAPVLTTFGALGLLGRHELAVGVSAHVPEAGALWDRADLVVAVGSDLDAIDTQGWRQPRPPALIAVNRDPADATKNYDADVVVARDAAQCAELAPPGRRAPWADAAAVREAALAAQPADARAFLGAFAGAVPDEAAVLVDMCLPGYWLMGFHRPAAPRRLHTPLGWGTLGFAFPAALGAACAGGRPVVSVSGDGGFLFACGELATVAQERPPLTAVIVDDQAYGMLRVSPGYDEPLPGPDFAALAASFGVRAQTVDGLGAAFGAALAAHVADPEPSVLVARAASLPASPTTSPRWYRAG